jgi:short-subunit dehydrogenase
MRECDRGAIVGIASLAGYAGFPRAEAYGSTKAAVIAFLQSLRIDLASSGVKVVTVSPGFVDTPLTRTNEFPMPFMLEPEEAAERIVHGLMRGDAEIHFPKRLSLPLKLLTALPRPVYEAVVRRTMARGG